MADLRALVGQCGPVINVEQPSDPAGIQPHRGFAHVTFSSESAALNCVAMLHGFTFHGRALKVERSLPSAKAFRGAPGPVGSMPRGGGGFPPRDSFGSHGFNESANGFNPRGQQQQNFQHRQHLPVVSQPLQQQAMLTSQPPPTLASVRSVVEAMSAAEQYDVLATLRAMCDTPEGRESAVDLLTTCPSFAHAVLMMEERLGMLQVPFVRVAYCQ